MAKFGKFLLSTAALVGTAATAYYIYKNVKIKVDVEEDEDLDDFSEEETEETNYVTLTPETSPVEEVIEKASEVAEEVKEKAADVVEEVKEAVTEAAEDFSTLAEQVNVEESVEEFFNDED